MNKIEIVEYIKERILDEEDNILNEVSKKIAYWVLTGKQYEVDYTENLPYDNSGEIYKVGEVLDKSKYNTLEDFLEEYTGNRNATYCSGCGWSYDNYSDELQYVINPLLYDIVEKCFQELKSTEESVINEITDLVLGEDDDELVYEYFVDYLYGEDIDAISYIEELKELSFSDVFKRGEFAAKRQLEEESKIAERRRCKDVEYRAIADELYIKYVELCGSKIETIASTNDKYTGHMFWKRENVFGYLDKIVYNDIKAILNNNFTKKELAILSRYKLITTNSVTAILESGIDFYN